MQIIYNIYIDKDNHLYVKEPDKMEELENFDLYAYNETFSDNIQLSYKGPFDSKVLSVIGQYILTIVNEKSEASQKLFKIFIELAQNIAFYSGEKSKLDSKTGMGVLLIQDIGTHYNLHTGNVIKREDGEAIIEKCEIINTLDRQGLRDFKRQQRNLPRGQKGTANVGLIQVALTSENPLKFKMTQMDDNLSFFSITVQVDK